MHPARHWLVPALGAVLISGCTLGPSRRAEPERPALPPPPADVNAIPDAVPRAEPRSKYGNPASYDVFGQRYVVLASAQGYVERGTASWYGPGFHGVRTSSGEPYDMYGMTAAHKTLPIPVFARVTNLNNGRSVVVRINDRGPFVGDRLIDLSWSAASKLDMLRNGTAPVEVRVLAADDREVVASNAASPVVAAAPIAAAPAFSASSPAPAPAATPTIAPGPPPSVAAPAGGNFLQAASFTDALKAQKLVQRLAESGIHNTQIREADAAGRRVWRVRVGPIANRLELDDYVERLSLLGIPDARLAHD